MSQHGDAQPNRRDFVAVAAAAAAGLGALSGLTGLPAALGQATTQPSAASGLDVGAKSDYTKDGVTTTWEKEHKLLVVRLNGRIYAMTSKCTHRGCPLDDAGDHLNCPCHNSDFTYAGEVIDGPAKKGLDHFGITVNEAGHLIVDVTKKFPQAKWDDAASYVTVGT
jgi:Rieske Fe-S protein